MENNNSIKTAIVTTTVEETIKELEDMIIRTTPDIGSMEDIVKETDTTKTTYSYNGDLIFTIYNEVHDSENRILVRFSVE